MTGFPIDTLRRHGFTSLARSDAFPSSWPTADALGYDLSEGCRKSLRELASRTAPFIALTDATIPIPAQGMRRAQPLLSGNANLPGLTFSTAALATILGTGAEVATGRSIGQTLTPVFIIPSWFCILRRAHVQQALDENVYDTPEFFLLDLGMRLQSTGRRILRLGSVELPFDGQAWAKDLIGNSAELLAADFERFLGRHGAAAVESVPPQFRLEAVGKFIEVGKPAQAAPGPKISVICPVFKPDFLEDMVGSVERQTWSNWELRILVDGPPAEAERRIADILARHTDPRISVAWQANRGTGPSRRTLGQQAAGDFVVSIDDDDMLADDVLEVFAAAAAQYPDIPVFRGGARLTGLSDGYLAPRRRFVVSGISNDCFEVTQPYAIRRETLIALGGFEGDESLKNAGEDTNLFHSIDAARLPTGLIDRPLYFRRLSTRNLTLRFEHAEVQGHFENLYRKFCPASWRFISRRHERSGQYQIATTVYAHANSGRQVVCSTKFFEYRTFGDLSRVTIDLELTSVCNAVCTFCPRDEMPDKTTFLAIERVRELADQLRGMRKPPTVVFCGIGESTLHPRLEEIAGLISGAGSHVSMTTNGARMNLDLFRRLVRAGIGSFNFSLNAATAPTHKRMMKLPGFETICETVRGIVAYQREHFPFVNIQVSCVVCDTNAAEVDEFVEQWRHSGVTQIWLHPLNNRAGLLAEDVRPVDLTPWAERFAFDPLVLVDLFKNSPQGEGLCKIARSMIFISADGEMRLCALDYKRENAYGNLKTAQLEEMHSDKLVAFLKGETHGVCQSCDFYPADAPGARQTTQADNGSPFHILGQSPGAPMAAAAVEPAEAKFQGLFCSQPFEYAQPDPAGELYLCCPQTLPRSAGNLLRQDFMSVWNSPIAQEIRGSILDGSYRYCSEATCGLLQSRKLPRVEDVRNPRHLAIIAKGTTRLARGPGTINFSYDRTCNLACPSCRNGLIILAGQEKEKARQIHEKVLGKHLADAERLIVTGSGDPFISKFYLPFLREFDATAHPGVRIQLSTNGLLLTERMWGMICHDAIDSIDVSIDAATPATYALNRGGDFDLLLKNLEFMGKLRRQSALISFQMHFVVQANNFAEMAQFVRLGERFHCDLVCFKQLVNWGTFSEREYAERAVQLPGHPLHHEFLGVLRDPIFLRPLVFMHDLSVLQTTVTVGRADAFDPAGLTADAPMLAALNAH